MQCSTRAFRPMDAPSATAILTWEYPPPYDIYNVGPERRGAESARLIDPANSYRAAFSGEDLVGFCCFGPDARVAGGDYRAAALDLGAGLRPDLTGRGEGSAFLREVTHVASA